MNLWAFTRPTDEPPSMKFDAARRLLLGAFIIVLAQTLPNPWVRGVQIVCGITLFVLGLIQYLDR